MFGILSSLVINTYKLPTYFNNVVGYSVLPQLPLFPFYHLIPRKVWL